MEDYEVMKSEHLSILYKICPEIREYQTPIWNPGLNFHTIKFYWINKVKAKSLFLWFENNNDISTNPQCIHLDAVTSFPDRSQTHNTSTIESKDFSRLHSIISSFLEL